MTRTRPFTACALALLLAALCALPTVAEAGKKKRKVRLKAFTSCTNLVTYGNRHLEKADGGTRFGRGGPIMPAEGGGEAQSDAPAASPEPSAGGSDSSTTNVQEAGIDEPDSVKTDGNTIFVLRDGVLHAIDARAETPRRLGRIDVPGDGHGHQMLLHDGKALVVHADYSSAGRPGSSSGSSRSPVSPDHQPVTPKTVLTEIDVSDPAAMAVLRSLRADGSFVSARLNGATARLVLRATPQAVYQEDGSRRAARWVPRGTFRSARTGRRDRRRLVRCSSVRRPASFSGLDTLTVLTVDMAKGLPAVDSDAIMADAETVYASQGSLYVASQRWIRSLENPSGDASVPDDVVTAIHRFDISEPGRTEYRSSGTVPGFLLNQFSLSEHEGVLRVASTEEPPWWGGDARRSESSVTVLDGRDGILRRIGSVGGLGKGERIYAVRFMGDVGYVVTFRQVDPLYTIDLSDPAKPEVLGELKITGYSAYLHPVAEDRLIGIGQEASEEGRRLGAQVSLFDVSDLRSPRLIAKHQLGGRDSHTDVEYDHHAFLWWPATALAVIPLSEYSENDPFTGAVGLRIADAAITEVGRVEHPSATPEMEWEARVERSLVVGDRLFTVSRLGVKASWLGDLSDAGYVGFG